MLRAAAARTDITPWVPCPLAGFVGRPASFTGTSSGLEANAVVFREESGRCALILTLDTLFIGPRLYSSLTEHFSSAHGQRVDDLFLLASHTHFAPSLDHRKPALGRVDSDYLAFVVEKCRDLIDQVMRKPTQPLRIRTSRGASDAAINRRLYWPYPHFHRHRLVGPQCVMAPNPGRPTDRTITTFVIETQTGEPIALFWHFACHPTGFPLQLNLSAEYPAVVRDGLRRRYGSDLPVLFFQGFAGDLRPRIAETRPALRRAFISALAGPSFNTFTPEGWQSWADALASDVLRTFESGKSAVETPAGIFSASSSVDLERLVTEEKDNRDVRFQRLRLAPSLDIVAVGAEPLVGLQAFVPMQGAISVGYLGDVFGYWPTDADAADGGYEANLYIPAFGLRGELRPSLDPIFKEAIEFLHHLK